VSSDPNRRASIAHRSEVRRAHLAMRRPVAMPAAAVPVVPAVPAVAPVPAAAAGRVLLGVRGDGAGAGRVVGLVNLVQE
jgi:hypothetical protein